MASYSIIYEADMSRGEKVAWYRPEPKSAWELTEKGRGEYAYMDYLTHRKWCGIVNQEQFDVLIDQTDLKADSCRTMGALGSPAFGPFIVDAVVFNRADENVIMSAYVSPIFDTEAEMLAAGDFETWRLAFIEKYK